ncbi:transcription cofactor vestigial-like protein 3 isoform X1 [Rhinopithecus roxellana]|uniref:Vestigial like family member 3 n=3 Tax=Cercopithecidae TaxID=9527 RepID=A0A2K5LEK8_CERAT|nr:PREDICTED: transcription cofactor vestigial-like protein 3 isoform X1 [Cercocebus atys]XP_017703655.1 PREDICTED: transcription cofactor vestigial-like protein 3 isoform X1 [Rhinopithecus bieti]XP_025232276.1 transcription cofactor vestigial-like protein 3 isoform X1 [Theropithecus gelada]XP_030795572.1 transcription cofactor vestigial-like protein 3 isoform X1 [Rhinopithecus roxellana]
MSCAEVMYHPQPYGASQYLPNPMAATTCPTAYYQPAPQPGQQKKLAVFSKMQDSLEVTLPSKQEEEDEEEEEEEEKDQPAEMEYLNSRCVLFTYFQGDIGSVVDEHFSRALGQAITLHPESAISKSKMGLTPLWRDSSALSSQRNSFPTSFWTSSYQPPPAPCLGGVHPDFQVTGPPGTFSAADPSPWPGHSLHQTGPAPPPAVSESWPYPLTSQVSPSYSHMHDVYMRHHHPHAHMRHRHHHHHHHHPPAGSALDPSYGPLLMPSVHAARIPAPQCDITKTEPTTVTSATSAWAGAFHGTVDIVPSVGFDTGLQHQDKSKESPWY